MVLEVVGVAVVQVEVFYEAGLAGPEKHVVFAVAEVVCEAATKIACSKDENSGLWGRGRGRRGHSSR